MRDVAQQLADLNIGEVAVLRGNALLDRPRALYVHFKKFVVVVRLDKKSGELPQALNHTAGNEARVGNKAEAVRSISDHKANGIDRVMLDREGLNAEVPDGKCLPSLEGIPNRALNALLADEMGSVPRGEHGDRLAFEEIFQATDMIAVLVGEQDAAERRGIDPELHEAQAKLFRAQAGVDEKTHTAAFEDCCVAGTAGA